jgi:Collagen triple helix repeat (20 copies)
MFSSFRTRFGIPGVISVIALVFAMFGGAYAASNDGGDGSKASASAKAKKGPRGPRGPRGPQGPVGPAGPQGPAGAPGAKGDAGANGKDGAPGQAGAKGATGATGEEGPEGEAGEEGSPWTAGGTLPSEETLTGTWSVSVPDVVAENIIYSQISFPIPLPAEISEANAHVAPHANCGGTVANPTADAGHLCVYVRAKQNVAFASGPTSGNIKDIVKPSSTPAEEGGATISGALLSLAITAAGDANAWGTWAVTAP